MKKKTKNEASGKIEGQRAKTNNKGKQRDKNRQGGENNDKETKIYKRRQKRRPQKIKATNNRKLKQRKAKKNEGDT